ncbi:MAG: hypothetical protein G3M78_11530 [Candidatus Nitrohelix vancouverensis]|uniref:Uncharacterized protein n=1 Tax=Candidatus Nitrohelix vancouverensis TaxID=2705534 RepID=A0A7T0G442_9BACT|nr:MAG: hypothetical protein G3M78_11530 [Candidatus Nitrohelix vancouverensis]
MESLNAAILWRAFLTTTIVSPCLKWGVKVSWPFAGIYFTLFALTAGALYLAFYLESKWGDEDEG